MPLTSGTRLGSYEVISPLGAGGMGEVYLARDTKLGRSVAVKIVREGLADPERVGRFEREAKVLASLNHPHIAALYGMEVADGRHFLVMELVEGETLADRLRRGAMPVEETLKVALQIAEALEAAHEKSIVHRDLKPANVKITPDEKVKVLDFGLAKAVETERTAASAADSPTLSMMASQAGIILGTAAYMSPEQAKGFPADHRSDVFSFGVVLYEMLTGRQPFQGETAPDVLASVLVRDPELTKLPPDLNPRLPEILTLNLSTKKMERFGTVTSTFPMGPAFSPDGKLVAFSSNETNANRVYLQPFPATGTRIQLYAKEGDGGHHVLWSLDGKELFYIPRLRALEVVPVRTQPTLEFGNPAAVPRPFETGPPQIRRMFDIARAGKFAGKFVALALPGTQDSTAPANTPEVHIVLNWFEELKARVPIK